MAMLNIENIRQRSETVQDYMKKLKDKAPSFIDRYASYKLDNEVRTRLKCHSEGTFILAFSAEWCPDCSNNIPILAHISDETGIEVRIFGSLERAAKESGEKWRVPPSPPEVKEFDIVKIPTIIIYNLEGERLGDIIENPPREKSLERAILDILES